MSLEKSFFKDQLVLVISGAGPHRDVLVKALREQGLQASFASDISIVTDLIAELRPATLVHDWASIDPSQGMNFQQRLGKVTEYAGLCRIIYAETITPQLVALASDCGVRRVVSYAATVNGLVAEIKMALAGMRNMSAIQQVIAKSINEGHYKQATIDQTVEKAYAQFSHDPIVKLEYGSLCLRRDELAKARNLAEELLALQPQNVRAMNLLARVMMKEGKMDEAIQLLENANGLSPFSIDRLLLLGNALLRNGDNAKASSYYGEVQAIDPGNKEAQKGLGEIKLSEGDINGALDLLKSSASEDESVGLFNNAAVHAARTGNFEKAYRLYLAATNALRTDRYKPQIFFNLAMTLERMGKLEEAYKYLKRSLKYDPDFVKSQRQKKRLESLLDAADSGRGKKKPA